MENLWETNPFSNGAKVLVLLDGTERLAREEIEYEFSDKDLVTTIQETSEIDALAYQFYQKFGNDPSKLYWYITDVNGVVNPLDLSNLEGLGMIIPDYVNIQRYL